MRLEQKATRNTIDFQRFAGIVVNDLPAIRNAADCVTGAEHNRISSIICAWIAQHGVNFIYETDDLVTRVTGITRESEHWKACESYTFNLVSDIVSMIFPEEAWS